MSETTLKGKDFLREIVEEDLSTGKYKTIITRFPPEPNGFLHIGHAKSICLNFGVAQEYGGRCHLRMDDTNPETEDMAFVESIIEMVKWMGFDWGGHLYYASDYFDALYDFAVQLIQKGKAYVDSQTEEEIRKNRGTVVDAGIESPYRNRSIAENLDLFTRMKNGAFPDGAHVLRAKGDMASLNMKMRDPLLYRIKHASHYRTGDKWCIYPFYDYAHPISDAIENISHSFCTLEFDNNRAIYDWLMDALWAKQPQRPYQHEFARLNLDYTVVSKRKLKKLVEGGYVAGWDDPRMSTLAAARRRGVTPAAIRDFCDKIGVAKTENRIDVSLLEWAIRNDLNFQAPRVMAVLRPLKVVLTNYPEGQTETLQGAYFPHDVLEKGGGNTQTRTLPFSKTLYIEQDDFAENPPKGFYRLTLGGEVRLRFGYIIKCEAVIKDEAGNLLELHCTYDPTTKSGADTSGKKVKGVIHWVDAATAVPADFRLYDRLFSVEDPENQTDADGETLDFLQTLNPKSLEILNGYVEQSLAVDSSGIRYQFERQGYFWQDPLDSKPEALVYNRIVTLRDSWTKQEESKPSVAKPTPKFEAPKEEKALAPEILTFIEKHKIPSRQAEIMVQNEDLLRFFEAAYTAYPNARALGNWISNEVNKELKEKGDASLSVTPAQVATLARLVEEGQITATAGKQVFAEMAHSGDDPKAIVSAKGLAQIADPAEIEALVQTVLDANPNQVAQYKAGNTKLAGFFTGKVMQVSGGKANPALVQAALSRLLNV